ncbi:MAG: DUF4139 domain-containing protein, partial [Bacteroidota bacterium]
MRVYSLLALCLLLLQSGLHAQETTKAKSDISQVTVFLRGAQITRSAKVAVKKGENIVQFEGLAEGIDARSIQASAPNVVLINSVVHEVNHLKNQKKSPRIRSLEDSLKILNEAIAALSDEEAVLNTEKTMILKNQSLAGKKKGVTTEELAKAADFFRTRLKDIHSRLLKAKQKKRRHNEHKTRINKQLKELNYRRNQPSNDITVKLKSDYSRTITLKIRYLVNNAGWIPAYDLRAKDTESPIQLDYRADVWQNTGIDWKQVELTLSSGDPRQGGTAPSLAQWNLYTAAPIAIRGSRDKGVYQYYLEDKERSQNESTIVTSKEKGKADISGGANFDNGRTLADYTTVTQGATTAEFAISVKQDIPSGAKKQQVSVQSSELPATYQHFAVPKIDKDAFLVAQVTDW